MKAYLDILRKVNETGEILKDRTGVGTKSLFGMMFEHDMRDGFPLLTTKKINPNTVFVEPEGFINGITDKKWYQNRGCFVWDEWCNPQMLKKYEWKNLYSVVTSVRKQNFTNPNTTPKFVKVLAAYEFNTFDDYIARQIFTVEYINQLLEPLRDDIRKLVQLYENDLGPVYGYQWRHFGKQYSITETSYNQYDFNGNDGIDQLADVIHTLKSNPTDRRMIISAWNPQEVKNNTMALPPCVYEYQFNSNGTYLDMKWSQRSVDAMLGLPWNIAQSALLLTLVAKEVGMTPRYLKGSLGNTHIYLNHVDQVALQLTREPRKLPTLTIPDENFSIFTWTHGQYKLEGYDPHPFIKAPVAV